MVNIDTNNIDNSPQYISIADVRSTTDTQSVSVVSKLVGKVDFQYYIAIDMNSIYNTDVYDNNVTYQYAVKTKNVFATPQLNNITFRMPPYPLVFQPISVPDVMIANFKIKLIRIYA